MLLTPLITVVYLRRQNITTLLVIASQLISIKSKGLSFRTKNKGIYTKRIRIRISKHKVKQGVSIHVQLHLVIENEMICKVVLIKQ